MLHWGHQGHKATLVYLVFCNSVAFHQQSVWCFLQVALLTDSRINLPIKDHRCAGSCWAPVGRKAKQTWDEEWTWNNHKLQLLLNMQWVDRNRNTRKNMTLKSERSQDAFKTALVLQYFHLSVGLCVVQIWTVLPEWKLSNVNSSMGESALKHLAACQKQQLSEALKDTSGNISYFILELTNTMLLL